MTQKKITPDELKQALIAAGWQVTNSSAHSKSCGWNAWMPVEGAPHNWDQDNAPSFCLTPDHYVSESSIHSNVTFSVRGQVAGGRALSLEIYSVPMDKALESVHFAKAVLLSAWTAATGTAQEEHAMHATPDVLSLQVKLLPNR